jgi:hypothetical protein
MTALHPGSDRGAHVWFVIHDELDILWRKLHFGKTDADDLNEERAMNNLFEKLQAKARAGRKPVEPSALPVNPMEKVDAKRDAEMKAEAAGEAARAKAVEAGEEAPEIGGPKGLEPTRFGDWEKSGRCVDF